MMKPHNYSAEEKLLRKQHQISKLEKVHINEKIKCFKCSKECSNWIKFNLHKCILKVSLKCFRSDCNFVAISNSKDNGKQLLKVHLQNLHQENKKSGIRIKAENQLSGNNLVGPVKCPNCHQMILSERLLAKHLGNCKPKMDKNISRPNIKSEILKDKLCGTCDQAFVNLIDLKSHERTVHNILKVNTENKPKAHQDLTKIKTEKISSPPEIASKNEKSNKKRSLDPEDDSHELVEKIPEKPIRNPEKRIKSENLNQLIGEANYDIDQIEEDIGLAFEICRILENEILKEKAGFWKIQNEKLEIENKISTMTKNWSIRFEEVQKTLKKIEDNKDQEKTYKGLVSLGNRLKMEHESWIKEMIKRKYRLERYEKLNIDPATISKQFTGEKEQSMTSESSSKRAQAMNDNHSFGDNFKSPSENHSFDNFKSPSLTSSTRKEIPPMSKTKFENPNPAEAFDDNSSSVLQETKYSLINQNNGGNFDQAFNPENVTKDTIAKYVKFLQKQEKYDDGPDICDDVIKRSEFNKNLEFDKGIINRHTRDFVGNYFENPNSIVSKKAGIPFAYEDNIFDDLKDLNISKDNILMSVDMYKSLLSPYQLIPSLQFSTLIKGFCNSMVSAQDSSMMIGIHQLLELLHDQLSYFPPITENLRVYYEKVFDSNITEFAFTNFKLAKNATLPCEKVLPIGLLKFAISVVKTEFSIWWPYRYKNPKSRDGYNPLIHNFYKDKQSGQVILNLDDLMKSQNNSELKNCMKDLYHMIATYTSFKEEQDCKLNSRKKENFKNATAVAYYDVLELNGCKRMKDLIVTVSLIRPSWMAALILALFLGDPKRFKEITSDDYHEIESSLKRILKNSLPISDNRLENLQKMGLDVILLLFSKLFDTMPMHIIANWMSKNTTYQRTLNFAYSESNSDKKHQKIPKEVDFQNIEIDRSVLVENVKTLVKKINDLNSTKFAPLDAWQFLSI